MPSPKTPYANTPVKPSTNRGIMNQNQRKQLDYLDAEAMPQAPQPKPAAPAVKPQPPRTPTDWDAIEREAREYKKKYPPKR
jgi:hypothetical protein